MLSRLWISAADVALLIKESFLCGYSSGQIQACCPDPGPGHVLRPLQLQPGSCALQGGKAASCVAYTQCSPFMMMLDNLIKPLPNVELSPVSPGRCSPPLCRPSPSSCRRSISAGWMLMTTA